MTSSLWYIALAGAALFLIGANLAVIARFWPEPWLTLKLVAVTALLSYVAMSVLFGDPNHWRVIIALGALSLEIGALIGIWHALSNARNTDGVLIAYRRR